MELWEILVPVNSNDGVRFADEYHHKWDDQVRALAGGLTVLETVKGQWVDNTSKLFKEPMIPVRVLADKPTIKTIVSLALEHYDQKAVMAYRISNEVMLVEKED